MAILSPYLQYLVVLATISSSVWCAPPDTGVRTYPCADVASSKKWVAPQDLRACYQSYPLDSKIRNNVNNFHQNRFPTPADESLTDRRRCQEDITLPHIGQLSKTSSSTFWWNSWRHYRRCWPHCSARIQVRVRYACRPRTFVQAAQWRTRSVG